MPELHCVHVLAPEAEKLPASQTVQEDAPALAAILPASQPVHKFEEAPVVDENKPGVHAAQVAPVAALVSVEYEPAEQSVHDVDDEAPVVVKYVPAGHGEQLDWPVVARY